MLSLEEVVAEARKLSHPPDLVSLYNDEDDEIQCSAPARQGIYFVVMEFFFLPDRGFDSNSVVCHIAATYITFNNFLQLYINNVYTAVYP